MKITYENNNIEVQEGLTIKEALKEQLKILLRLDLIIQ